MVIAMILAAGIGMILGSLNVRYRDFQYVIPFLLQIWLYASPIVYSVQIVPKSFLFWYYLNPMAGLIDLFRFAVTGQTSFHLLGFLWSILGSILIFVLGLIFFSRTERTLADFV
jgi:lipopolysaccharide transport system permease protein